MTEKNMSVLNAGLNLAVLEGATKKQLQALIDEYFVTAAVVTTDRGLRFMQTDRPVKEYTVSFSLSGCHMIRAESEEAACDWVKSESPRFYDPGMYGDAYISACSITSSWQTDEDEVEDYEDEVEGNSLS